MTRFAIVTDHGGAGFILCRRHEFEAFDADEVSLGLFETEDGARATSTMEAKTVRLFESGRRKTGGRAKGAKNRLSHAFLTALAEDFEQHGIDALRITRTERPAEYIKIVAGLMPKEFEIMDSRLNDLSDEELDVFIAKLRAQLGGAVTQDLGDGENPSIN